VIATCCLYSTAALQSQQRSTHIAQIICVVRTSQRLSGPALACTITVRPCDVILLAPRHAMPSTAALCSKLTASVHSRRAGQRQVSQLGDPDSRFRQLQQLLVHVKCQDAAPTGSAPDWGIHCYHGFGSNYISWSLVQAPLAQQLRAVVTAHDMPGFGLTAR
jgi:hypothetical protein